MRTTTFIIIAALIITAAVSSAPAYSAIDLGRKTMTGVVTDVNFSDDQIRVDFDRADNYKLYADEALVRYQGRNVRLSDIRRGDKVRVDGSIRSDRTMNAYRIDVIGRGNWRDDDRYDDRYYDRDSHKELGRAVTVTGRVTSVDTRRNRVEISTSSARLLVIPGNGVDILEDGRRRSLRDIRTGDYITVTGSMLTRSTLAAQRINIGADRRDYGRDKYYGRDRDYRRDRDYGYFGKIDKLDTRRGTFRLKVERTDYTVEAGRAAFFDNDGDRIRIENLRNGQTVWVQGELRGGKIYAERVGQGSYYVERNNRYRPSS